MYKNQYKEKTYVKEILGNGFASKYLLHEMKLLTKYYKEEGRDEEERKESLYKFCEEKIKKFNKVTYYKTINNALNYVKNKDEKLVEIESIDISKSELNYIDRLNIDEILKKLVFTLLVLVKLNKTYLELKDGELKNKEYYFGGHNSYRELTSCSKVAFNKKKGLKNIHDLIRILHEKNIVEIVGRGKIKLLFMYEIEDDTSEEIEIKFYDVIGYYYDRYKGDKKIKECENCETLIKTTSNRQIYCKDCKDEKWKEYNSEKQREYRKK